MKNSKSEKQSLKLITEPFSNKSSMVEAEMFDH